MKVEPVKGTRDFLPEQKFVQNWIFDNWKKVAEAYAFEDFDAPMLEPAELWQLKSGGEIPEQMYTLEDKNGRKLAIRPELTPSLARMMAANARSLPKPIKLYSIARCWRYEQPQKGRLREFFQFNLDLLGISTMQADAEVIATAIRLMQSFGLDEKDFYIRLSNRKIINSILNCLNVENVKEVCRIIDKKDKISREEFEKELKDLNLNSAVIKKLGKALEAAKISELDKNLLDETGISGLKEISELIELLNFYGVEKFVRLDLAIARGFDYYTSTVFEVFDSSKKFRALAGGGRYNNLVSDFGGEELQGIGYGMGDVTLELFLREKGKIPNYDKGIDYFVATIGEKPVGLAIKAAERLREKGFKVELEISGKKLSKQLEYANKIGAKKLIVIGEEEEKTKKFKIKDMLTRSEEKASIETL